MRALAAVSLKALQVAPECRPGDRGGLGGRSDDIWAPAQWVRGAVKEPAKHRRLREVRVPLGLGPRPTSALPVWEHLGPSSVSGLRHVLFKMPVFDFLLPKTSTVIFTQPLLCGNQEFSKNKTKYPSAMSLILGVIH